MKITPIKWIKNFLYEDKDNTLLEKILCFKNREKKEDVVYVDSSQKQNTDSNSEIVRSNDEI